MATNTAEEVPQEDQLNSIWLGSVVGGLLGGVLFGFVLQFVMNAIKSVGALYGIESVAGGWIFHLFHAGLFGLAFGLFVTTPSVRSRIPDPGTLLFLGIIWGMFLWLVAAGYVMPVWLEGVGAVSDPPIPNIQLESGVGHFIYGVALAGVIAFAERERFKQTADR